MSSVLNLLRQLPVPESRDDSVTTDQNYVRRSSSLVKDSLEKGSDVLQMPNGDIVITEVKTVIYTYSWNKSKGKFERQTNGTRRRRRKLEELESTEKRAYSSSVKDSSVVKEKIEEEAFA